MFVNQPHRQIGFENGRYMEEGGGWGEGVFSATATAAAAAATQHPARRTKQQKASYMV